MLRGLERLFVDDERIKFVEYKYLGCKMTSLIVQGWWRKGRR